MKRQKLLSLFLSLLFLLGSLNIVAAADSSSVGYKLYGEADGKDFTLHVSLQNVKSRGGRLAIKFDKEKLELADTSSVTAAIQTVTGVALTQEGIDRVLLISNRDGYAMFAWYTSGYKVLDASSRDVEIAAIPFRIKDGVTVDDFNRNTISLYYVNQTMLNAWDCSASIVNDNLIAYKNNAINDSNVCHIEYEYPNCDYVPIITYDAAIHVTDSSGNPITANVTFDSLETQTDSSGQVSFSMEDGVYAYRVSAENYETRTGYLIINGNDETLELQMKSYQELAQSIADDLEIGYAQGDSSAGVTANLSLVTSSDYGDIIWTSDKQNIVTDYGTVQRPEDDTKVTLTATVYVGTASASKSFELTVKSRLTAEEKNAIIVAKDKEALTIGYSPGDSQNSVTSTLELKEKGPEGSGILWVSSNDEIIDKYGHVERPGNDTEVKLTAYLTRGLMQDTKEFTVTVKGTNNVITISDEELVKNVIDALTIDYADGDSAESVKNNLTLPQSGAEDVKIEWTSSQPAVITAYGGVVRQAEDVSVTLTAAASKGSQSAAKTFTVLVKAAEAIPVNPNNGQEAEIISKNARSSSGGSGSTRVTETPKPSETPQPEPTTAPESGERFTDIASVPWAREAILTLAERGIISGTSETTYSPQNNIRRADFITLLARMLKLDGEITDTFEDVPEDKYYYKSVSTAKSLGIISGIDAAHFNPEGSITRQDMMVMTYQALTMLKLGNMSAANLDSFKDADSIADYAYESVSNLVGGGYISGDDQGNLNPISNTTRAETAVFLYKLGL